MQRVSIGLKIRIVVRTDFLLLFIFVSNYPYEGQTSVRSIVDCIDENYATTCLVLGMNSTYHMLTIRSITERELSFDWFLIDNRVLSEVPQLSCAFK